MFLDIHVFSDKVLGKLIVILLIFVFVERLWLCLIRSTVWSLVPISMWCGRSQDCIFQTGDKSTPSSSPSSSLSSSTSPWSSAPLQWWSSLWSSWTEPRYYIFLTGKESITPLQKVILPLFPAKIENLDLDILQYKSIFLFFTKSNYLSVLRFLHELNESDSAGLVIFDIV